MRCLRIRHACLVGVLLPALALSRAGHAQVESREGIALQNQVYQLRQDLQLLRAEVARGGGGGGGGSGGGGEIAAQLLSRVQAMEEQVRQLRGRIDETQNLLARQNADLSKRIDDLTFQMNLPGRSGALSPPPTPPQVPAPPPVREVAPRPAPEPLRAPDTPRRPDLFATVVALGHSATSGAAAEFYLQPGAGADARDPANNTAAADATA